METVEYNSSFHNLTDFNIFTRADRSNHKAIHMRFVLVYIYFSHLKDFPIPSTLIRQFLSCFMILNDMHLMHEFQVLVALQAALTVLGNATMCIAAFRIYRSQEQ